MSSPENGKTIIPPGLKANRHGATEHRDDLASTDHVKGIRLASKHFKARMHSFFFDFEPGPTLTGEAVVGSKSKKLECILTSKCFEVK